MIKVPPYAKQAAIKGLEERKMLSDSKKFGLNYKEAKSLGIASGVRRAYQLKSQENINEETGKRIGRFYARFKNCETPKCEGAINIWGGRRFGKKMYNKFYGGK